MEEEPAKRCINLAGSRQATHALQLCFTGAVPKVDIPLFVFLNGESKAAVTFGRGLTDVKVASVSTPLAISNVHARMDYVAGVKVWQLTDLSTNGIRVTSANGVRLRLEKGKPHLLLRDTVVTFAVADVRFKFIDLMAGKEGCQQRAKELEDLASYWLKFPDGPGPATPPLSPVLAVEDRPCSLKRSHIAMCQPVSPRDEVTVWEEYIPGSPASEGEARANKKSRAEGGRAVAHSGSKGGDKALVAGMVTCGLCSRLLANAHALLPCSHLFCAECIDQYDRLCRHEHRCPTCMAAYCSHYVLQPWADAVAEALLAKSAGAVQGETHGEWQVRGARWEELQAARCSQGPRLMRNRHRVTMLLRALATPASPGRSASPMGSDNMEMDGSVGRVGRLLACMSTDDVTK